MSHEQIRHSRRTFLTAAFVLSGSSFFDLLPKLERTTPSTQDRTRLLEQGKDVLPCPLSHENWPSWAIEVAREIQSSVLEEDKPALHSYHSVRDGSVIQSISDGGKQT